MITQSPESAMPEPYKTYVRQRSAAIANVLLTVVGHQDVQLCPRAILPEERIFTADESIVYGVEVDKLEHGFKSALYSNMFDRTCVPTGLSTTDNAIASSYTERQLNLGNRVRLKDPQESDGQGQCTVESMAEFEVAFLELGEQSPIGVVVMPHFETVNHRVSVGRIELGAAGVFNYVGRENTTQHNGGEVYGGTQLALYAGSSTEDLEKASQALDLPIHLAQMGERATTAYKRLVRKLGRASFDVIEGLTDNGSRLRSVIDITPRVGGTTPAEVLAIQAVSQASNKSKMCLAASQLLYNPASTPNTGVNFIDTKSLVINAEVQDCI